MTRAAESNARESRPIRYLARALNCRYCDKPIYVALCSDGRWRSFERAVVPPAAANVWAWRKRQGMQENDIVAGHHLHFCAEYDGQSMHFAQNFVVEPPS